MGKTGDKFTVFVTDHLPQAGWDILNTAGDVIAAGPFESRPELLGVISEVDAIIIRSATKVDPELLDAAQNLKVIAKAGAQIHNIDIEEATRRGIMVLNAPNANRYAIVEHTFGLILALARQIPHPYRTQHGGGSFERHSSGFQLYGKTLGLLGFGVIGTFVARVMGLKFNVLNLTIVFPQVVKNHIRELFDVMILIPGNIVDFAGFEILADICQSACRIIDEGRGAVMVKVNRIGNTMQSTVHKLADHAPVL